MGVIPYHVRDYSLNTNVMQAAGLITFVKTKDGTEVVDLATRLLWAREQRGYTQATLAKRAEVAQTTIANVERGIRKKPRELVAIARALRVNAHWLDAGKGDWNAEGEKGAVFHEPSPAELEMLDNLRNMDDADLAELVAEAAKRSARYRATRLKIMAAMGISTPETRAANAGKQAIARASVEVGKKPSPQKSLFDPKGEKHN